MKEFIGQPLVSLPTPALVVDIAALDHNLNLAATYFAPRRQKLRPHFKSHKCVTLAKRQLQAGNAVGITCAKLGEAEKLVAGGVRDVLIANEVVGSSKAERLARLNKNATVRCAVDSAANAAELGVAALKTGITIGVLVEVDIGMRRCGVAPGEAALTLARQIHSTKGLRFDGLQAYEGHLVTLPEYGERKEKVGQAMEPLLATRRALETAGLPCKIVSGGGSGTYDITGNLEVFDEIQAGSYALMDNSYKKVRTEFQNALSLLVTVISSKPDYLVVDVGLKGMGNEFGPPVIAGVPQAKARGVAEEHVPFDGFTAPVGTKLRVIPSHGCTTCNLHRRLWVARGDIIEDVWPIEASGCLE